jgi:hypothetical protein
VASRESGGGDGQIQPQISTGRAWRPREALLYISTETKAARISYAG